ncbi:MAG: helix-turn-helix transcriptional regulator [Planctomycetes bacterium]|nr:helix-turn-helix transcriptional regulator [Planctomycetota bacterium]
MELHKKLRLLIGEAGAKQNEVAACLGVRASTVNQWVQGKEICGPASLARIVQQYVQGTDEEKKRELCRLLILLQSARVNKETGDKKSNDKWGDPSLKTLALDALDDAYQAISETKPRVKKTSGRTLCDFPASWYPLSVITGDKRETSESRIGVGDFGTVSASPAEIRWLLKLGLEREVECFTDKVFVLEDVRQLKARFAETNLLVIGSPASNHLARRLLLSDPRPGWRRGVPVFRFNFEQRNMGEIEGILDRLSGLHVMQLLGEKGDLETERRVKFWLHQLFGGGIIDPTYRGLWKRASALYNLDFGLISLARNPFSDPEKPYVCILAAGFHLFGTAHALRMLSEPETQFESHPLGGVIRVDYDPGADFAERFDSSVAKWDTESDYTIDDVKSGLNALRGAIDEGQETPPGIHITRDEIEECLKFIDEL